MEEGKLASERAAGSPAGRLPWIPYQIKLIFKFALHVLVGLTTFALIGGAAVVLNYFATWIEKSGISPYVIYGFHGIEFFLFAVDAICCVIFVGKEAWIFVHEIVWPQGRAR